MCRTAAADDTFASERYPNSNFNTYQDPGGYHEMWHGYEPGYGTYDEVYIRFNELAETLGNVHIDKASLEVFPYWQYYHNQWRPTWVRRIAATLILFAVITVIAIDFVRFLRGRPEGEYHPEIGRAIELWAVPANVDRPLSLPSIATFEWDRVIFLPPYATNQMAADQLGFDWNVEQAPTWSDDSANLIGFALDEKVVGWTTVMRQSAELSPGMDGKAVVLLRNDAVLVWNGRELVPRAGPLLSLT